MVLELDKAFKFQHFTHPIGYSTAQLTLVLINCYLLAPVGPMKTLPYLPANSNYYIQLSYISSMEHAKSLGVFK